MTRHQISLLLHVSGAILWVGRGRRRRRLPLAPYVDLGVLLPVLTATALKPGRSDRAAVALVAVLPVAGAVPVGVS